MSLTITSYGFGALVVEGREYTKDVLLLGDRVHSPWWREQGHVLQVADLAVLKDHDPDVLVIGTGAYGALRVHDEVIVFLQGRGVNIIIEKTDRAVTEYNALLTQGKKVYGAFHLTC